MYYKTIDKKTLSDEYIKAINNNDMNFKYEILTDKTSFSIRLRDFNNNHDCKIENFGFNLYLRPKKALSNKMTPYKSFNSFNNAIQKTLKANNLTPINWIDTNN